MIGRAAQILVLAAAFPALAEPPAGRPLTSAEQRVLDGAYLYMISPEYCEPALSPEALRAWIAGLIKTRGVAPEDAAAYLTEQEPRLHLFAEAAFHGRRGQELCRSIYMMRETTPDLRPAD